jgi:hypothetical protein
MNGYIFLLDTNGPGTWSGNWAWGVPLIILTVVIHVLGLGLIRKNALNASASQIRRHPTSMFVGIMGLTTLVVICLHTLEAYIWAVTYWLLGALPDFKSAMLYSLNAMTSYGHINLTLEQHWHLMGALEALNGWLLFGLSTAFLFAVIERVAFESSSRESNGS